VAQFAGSKKRFQAARKRRAAEAQRQPHYAHGHSNRPKTQAVSHDRQLTGRGIGIINVAQMFGVKAIRREKQVDLVISLRAWEHVPDVDRLGMEQEFVKILGVEIPHITIPVRPGRDIARLVEVAALQTKLKNAGFNAAKDLNERILAQMKQTAGL
jgi:hypothetical protein